MRWFCLPTFFLLSTLLPAQAGHSAPKILLNINVQTSGEGLPLNQAHSIAVPPNGETILIRTLPEITQRDLVDVQVDASDAVHFRFNHDGQVALNAVTAQNQGRILVLMLNGYILYAPVIDEQISDGELIMPHHLDPKVIQLLQETAQKNLQQAARQ